MKEKCLDCYDRLPFEFSISSYKLIFVFIFPLFGVAHNRFRDKYLKEPHEYFNILLFYISYIFSFILFIIFKIISRRNKKNIKSKEQLIKNTDEDTENQNALEEVLKKKNRIKMIKSIAIIIFLCLISFAYNHFNFEAFVDKKTIGIAYKIPEFFLLSAIILKYKYYKHHYIMFGLNIFTMLAKYTILIIQSKSEEYVPYHLWFYLLFSITYCFFLVVGKYYMEKYFVSPYFIMFILGIIISSILLIIAVIKYYVTSESQIFTGFNNNLISGEAWGYFIGDVISQFIFNLGLWITVYYFSPCHTIISENVMELMYYIYDYSDNEKYWNEMGFYLNFYLMPIVCCVNIILSLIFNEIIILKFCDLDYYTYIRIKQRERRDSSHMNKLNNILTDGPNRGRNSGSSNGSIGSNDSDVSGNSRGSD